ncbi:hypothetical protein [Corynebacterium cystitidis]|nr:hypothetical protein [Corynebacterium cystitidis]
MMQRLFAVGLVTSMTTIAQPMPRRVGRAGTDCRQSEFHRF